jgi:uncharacterized protein YeaO (DUF488 family)
MIQLKRVYEPAAKSDGYRVLVDRLWPRGLSKAKVKINVWLKDIGPSNDLRKWFGHDPKRWPAFRSKYRRELKLNKAQVAELKRLAKAHPKLTLLYGAHDEQHNQAVVLAEILK